MTEEELRLSVLATRYNDERMDAEARAEALEAEIRKLCYEATKYSKNAEALETRIKTYEFRWAKMRERITVMETDYQRARALLQYVLDCDMAEQDWDACRLQDFLTPPENEFEDDPIGEYVDVDTPPEAQGRGNDRGQAPGHLAAGDLEALGRHAPEAQGRVLTKEAMKAVERKEVTTYPNVETFFKELDAGEQSHDA
jgi:hypothetical protein